MRAAEMFGRWRGRGLALLAGLCLARVAAAQGVVAPLAPAQDGRTNRADYRIEARADDADQSLAGEEWITWQNQSGEPVGDFWFHLYLNAFSNNRSTHMTEARGKLRDKAIEEGWGWQRVTGVWLVEESGETDLFGSFRYRQPDDANPEDKTVFSVDAPAPIAPGQSATLRVTWDSRLPRLRRRTGIKGDFIFAAQWFPKLGVYEAGRGWNCHQFHMSSEFYSNFGTYDVTIDLPSKYADKVGGSGVVERTTLENDRSRTRFLAPSPDDRQREDVGGRQPLVHDFAWTADPDFEVYEDVFKFREWAERYPAEVERVTRALGRARDDVLGRNVDVRVLIQPEHAAQAARHFEATSTALFFYGLWWGAYPYEQITAVDPAWGGNAAGGMEYPTIFTAGTRSFRKRSMHTPESVIVHEAGHQFWYGLVANNEFEAAWLDEGLNSYSDSEALWKVYGARAGTTEYAGWPLEGVALVPTSGGRRLTEVLAGRNWRIPWTEIKVSPLGLGGLADAWRDQPLLSLAPRSSDPRWSDRSGYLADPDRDPIDTWAFAYADRRSYRTNSYPRTAVALRTLASLVGDDEFLRGMRHFAETWRYRHPYPDDFFAAFVEGSGADVGWYFDEVFRGTGTVDWAVEVETRKASEPKGYFQAAPGEAFEPWPAAGAEGGAVELASTDATPALEGTSDPGTTDGSDGHSEPAPLEGAPQATAEPISEGWLTTVLVTRHGELALPLEVELVFEGRDPELRVWTRAEQLERRWLKLEYAGEHELLSVRLDPSRGYYLDTNMSNNQWHAEPDRVAPLRWSERVFAQVSQYLHWMSTIGG